MDQYEIAEIFREIALILDFQDETPFRSMAYKKAARALESVDHFEELVIKGQMTAIPGIGKEISRMIYILFRDEPLTYLQDLRKTIPESVFELLLIPKLGRRRAKFLYHEFNIRNLDEFEEALQKGIIPRFKNETVSKFLKSIKRLKKKGSQLLWQVAMKIALSLKNKLIVDHVEIVGQLRRKIELISHIEIITENKNADILDIFSRHSFVKAIIYKKSSKIRVLLKQKITADLSLVKKENWAFGMISYTGSKAHLKELKKESALLELPFRQKKFKYTKNEKEIYQKLNMEYIAPELREGLGEIQAAKENCLPDLIEKENIRGVFHCHTSDSDGINSLEEMAIGAKNLGWEYIGISDHSKSSRQANGLDEERLWQQVEMINKLNEKFSQFRIFSGIECDILKDGSLDFADDILKNLDFVIVSVHSLFHLNKNEMTKRIIKAIENPYTTIVGHVSGRLLRLRDPYQIDICKIIDACAENGKVIELNATPNRLDMDWRYWHLAKEKGVRCAINPDAHSLENLNNYKLGINIARKGWLEKKDVINTMTLNEMELFLR